MIIKNEDVQEIVVEIPEGHKHIRTTIRLKSGQEFVFQEATISNLLRAFITVKTHPQKTSIRLVSKRLDELKPGYAPWQLLEED